MFSLVGKQELHLSQIPNFMSLMQVCFEFISDKLNVTISFYRLIVNGQRPWTHFDVLFLRHCKMHKEMWPSELFPQVFSII